MRLLDRWTSARVFFPAMLSYNNVHVRSLPFNLFDLVEIRFVLYSIFKGTICTSFVLSLQHNEFIAKRIYFVF